MEQILLLIKILKSLLTTSINNKESFMNLKRTVATVFLMLTVSACSTADKDHVRGTKMKNIETANQNTNAVDKEENAYYTVLEFNKGNQRLSDAAKRDLREFVKSAKKEGREIDDIKILSWADKEYPGQGPALSDRDIKIASERSDSILKYLKDDLKTDGDYATYNMAKRPNKISEFFKSDDYRTKRVFEKPGFTPIGTQISAFMKNKTSKALIMIDYL